MAQPIAPWEIILAARISDDRLDRVLKLLKMYDELKTRSVAITVNQFRRYADHKPANHPNAAVGAMTLLEADNADSLNSVVPNAAINAAKNELLQHYTTREFDPLTQQQVEALFPKLWVA